MWSTSRAALTCSSRDRDPGTARFAAAADPSPALAAAAIAAPGPLRRRVPLWIPSGDRCSGSYRRPTRRCSGLR